MELKDGVDVLLFSGNQSEGMAVYQKELEFETRGKGTYEITHEVEAVVRESGVRCGTATVFVKHTSASLVLMENADPSARRDLEMYFDKLVPEDTDYFIHTYEGADDMPSHIRMALTRSSEVIPVNESHMMLGTWQGIFLFEHRRAPHRRRVVITVVGE
jgi:secondary thiamine-phosphate synthase enzyme